MIFASFASEPPSLELSLGPTMIGYFDRVFNGRPLEILGYSRQRIPCNWKLIFENIKDPYHASTLHVFLVTFGLFRADTPAAVKMDPSGAHSVLISSKRDAVSAAETAELATFRKDLSLNEPELVQPIDEFDDPHTAVMQTIWPNLIVQQQVNTLATRHIVPRGPGQADLLWTFFGYAGEDPVLRRRRLLQANLMGPAGLVSVDDGEVLQQTQDGASAYPEANYLVEMGGRDLADADHMVTEVAIRAFYQHYREVMDL
ncbi:Ring hydroxylating alpha subunit (catalytic domain) [Lentzea flava]|nr:Ring hydroxylating alpha subunit (catalytic domain) [Lentzea flava]